ncbi:ABC transporter substrate-binding protein [Bacillus licheniformis]|uniref:ABC transporter substrate-binding protein n=1 Tax=Bacillus licheniformis TaxID=1402 RepID=UPI00018C8FBD|nr:iron-siderophore ABC transporter substrate-binding protein [Bacillus licheniformis]MED4410930.1 iron-siderophore ABC transporter substrate-binding protein [Bacillus licheniformis]QDL77786.1 iron-siderophore ABC transporter substrate-binding protein [Bacillus licheniformis]
MKRFKWFALFAALILLLAACGNQDKDQSAEKNGSKDSYTVKHAMGTATIDGTPKKVVVLTNEATEAVLALGVKPVGAVQSWLGDPWYDHIKDKMKGVENVGTEAATNIEKIASLKPDLIIGNKIRQEEVYDKLKAIAPTVFAETLSGEWKNNFKLTAEALNKKAEGEKVIADFDKRVEDIHEKLGDKVKQKVSLVRFTDADTRIYHKGSFAGTILDQLGFARPKGQEANDLGQMEVTKEQIPDMDGDVLFYYTYETGDDKASAIEKDYVNDPLFKNLNVSKKGNVHKVSDAIWNTAGGVLAANLMLDDIEKYFLK